MKDIEILKQVLEGNHLELKEVERLKQLSYSISNRLESELRLARPIQVKDFTKVNHDSNGNPRYVIHYLAFSEVITDKSNVYTDYAEVLKWCNSRGGKKFHNKQYGGGIAFQTYNLLDTCDYLIDELKKEVV